MAMTPGGGFTLPFYEEHKTFNVKLSRISINIRTVCRRNAHWWEMHLGNESIQVSESINPFCHSLLKCPCQAIRDTLPLSLTFVKRVERVVMEGDRERYGIISTDFHPEKTFQLICMKHLWFNWLCWQLAYLCDWGRVLVKVTSVLPGLLTGATYCHRRHCIAKSALAARSAEGQRDTEKERMDLGFIYGTKDAQSQVNNSDCEHLHINNSSWFLYSWGTGSISMSSIWNPPQAHWLELSTCFIHLWNRNCAKLLLPSMSVTVNHSVQH